MIQIKQYKFKLFDSNSFLRQFFKFSNTNISDLNSVDSSMFQSVFLTWSHQPLRHRRERWWERWSVRLWDRRCSAHRLSSSSPAGRNNSSKQLKHTHLVNDCKVEISLNLTDFYIQLCFFTSESLRLWALPRILLTDKFLQMCFQCCACRETVPGCVLTWTKAQTEIRFVTFKYTHLKEGQVFVNICVIALML